jgi:thiol-disulfide isomerase/thioredoxin
MIFFAFPGVILAQNVTVNKEKDNPRIILENAIKAVKKIKNGSYEIKYKFKCFDCKSEDTLILTGNCDFRKVKDDPLNANFHYTVRQSKDTSYTRHYYYDGNSVTVFTEFPHAIINSYPRFRKIITNNTDGEILAKHLITSKSLEFFKSDTSVEYLIKKPDEQILGKLYYAIEIKLKDQTNLKNYVLQINIDKQSFLPVRFRSNVDLDDQHEYQESFILRIVANKLPGSVTFGPENIPNNYRIEEMAVEIPLKPLLDSGTVFPDIAVTDINNNTHVLSQLKDKIILVDFWFRGCGPCLKSIPGLVALYERYKDKGLIILGLNAFDKNKLDEIKTFVKQKNISYPVILLPDQTLLKRLNVNLHPALYIIGQDNIIKISFSGYDEVNDSIIERTVQNLIQQK